MRLHWSTRKNTRRVMRSSLRSPENAFYELMADDALGAATVYVTGDVHYRIPFGERKISYSPKTFSGNRHLITQSLRI